MDREKVSVTVITRDEEGEIDACLQSLAWADEIVVVDSGSTDRTVEIARKYTEKVFHHVWSGYADQKNWAIDQASHPWILSVDADERVPKALQEEIKQVLGSPSPYAGYLIPRKNFFLGRWIRHGGWSPDHVLRLFKRESGRFGERKVHESIRLTGPVGTLESPLEHYTYRSMEDYFDRMDRYSTLAAEEMFEQGKRANGIDLFLRPWATFIKMVFLRQGFRDGIDGLLLGRLYSVYTFSKYAKLYKMGVREKQNR
ncbi:MAG: glycosyltransferase family 2 protein [Candidatus Manganitrophus sp.]|nr:glycosyltransferase family 2 protein [Candidatus Manganitrophus sp.]MDC4223289.1 glycosyltransferase family 2 protein [Candidatus Manganitrophus sp.]WDT71610.1 MAG: glycosyltransferase family 2 protein [Candidatus Manganitrophus sp.]WDT81043.1 MAG: glycosyltransferase family 2 protein [Candidatus Manganitrophus sp.]